MRRRDLMLMGAVALAGCATAPPPARPGLPEPRLAPSSLGVSGGLSLAQRLTVRELPAGAPATERSLDVQLEVDAAELRLAAFALNQRVLMLRWDGRELQQQRHLMLPAEVDGARVLRDIQLAYWPREAIAAALPAGWSVEDAGPRRLLRQDQVVQMQIDYGGEPRWQGRAEIDNRLEHYRLSIESTTVATSP